MKRAKCTPLPQRKEIMILDTEYAYIAGIMDGEGTIALQLVAKNHSKSYAKKVLVTNTDRRLLDWIRLKTRVGIVAPKTKPKEGKNWKQCYELSVSACEMKRFLEPLMPYLLIKKRQAEVMLEFITIEWTKTKFIQRKPMETAVYQEILYDELSALNKRGL